MPVSLCHHWFCGEAIDCICKMGRSLKMEKQGCVAERLVLDWSSPGAGRKAIEGRPPTAETNRKRPNPHDSARVNTEGRHE
jgi:hypothetical protein